MKSKIKNIHLFVIIFGIIFNVISIFQPNLWFDESYSVGIASKSFAEIWTIGGNDVHPILYYWILHIIYLATSFANSINVTIIAYRIFSFICIALLGILGYTHIRKDFGEKTGLFFSFFSYFLPAICIYSAEVRMYSLAILLVTILAIYAYRLAKVENKSVKNWAIFGITSLACIYTHYYGLMAAGIINLVLLVCLIKQKRTKSIVTIISLGVMQLLAYIPWIMNFLKQLKQVSKGFWIGFEFPKTLVEILSSQFIGNLLEDNATMVAFIISIIIYIYICYKIYSTKKEGENIAAPTLAISIYLAVIVAAILMTIVLKTSILYYRYLFVITGLLIFFISFYIAREKNKYIIYIVCGVTLLLACFSNYAQISEAYGKDNMTQISYLKENVQAEDTIVFDETNFGSGSVVALNFTNNNQIYYNPSNWGVEAAYRAFGEQLHIYTDDSFVGNLNGRIWVIDNEGEDNYNKLFNNENFQVISKKLIKTQYENYVYNFILVERVQ